MKMKNRNQYKIKKSQDGGENNVYKYFTRQVEEGYIPNTTSYVELFMNTMEIKNSCNGYQYKMQKSQDGGGNNAYKIFYELGGGGMHSKHNILCGTVHDYHENKKYLCNGHQYEMQKSWDGGEIMPVKSLCAGCRRDTFQTQHPVWNCSWLP